MSVDPGTIGVIGAGAWGTALAILGARAGRRTLLWTRDAEAAGRMAAERRNEARPAGHRLPASACGHRRWRRHG